jgi:eukaryotic-like serine/threonine-protein kinase
MSSGDRCQECGAEIPAGGPPGLCARCLIGLGIGQAEPEVRAGGVPTEKPGDQIGNYKLLQEIGRGGFGVVYLAEQQEPVRRRVALKIIKLGMDTEQVVARFEAERQALALMDHPNIAKVLEASATDAGRPYFVMELVGGIKITDYCEQNHLATRQRLDLFIQVCRAVQHAHQKGIIHRDIKPSNVLVAEQDGVPVPKVIDFGIAKATQGRLTDDTVFTAFEQFLGTPAYMSPEQAQPGGLDVDTRSDIYSLGVLLYELLTRNTPFDTKELLAAGLDAMRRTIQEKEPPTPSTRLKQDAMARQADNSDKSKIKNQKSKIENDLDWIVMKCLEKDRGRRYETANGLAMDIQRHLNDEPVMAGPPSSSYRLRKLVRRNKVLFVSAGGVVSALVLGLAMSSWLFVRERAGQREQARLRQRAEANEIIAKANENTAHTEAAKSRQVAQFLKDMLAGVGPSRALGRDTTMLKEILDQTANRIYQELTNQPEVQLELGTTLADTYHELGLYGQMVRVAQQDLRIARSLPVSENPDAARALKQLGDGMQHLGDLEQAEKYAREACEMYRGLENFLVATPLGILATILRERGKMAEAEAVAREAVNNSRAVMGDHHKETATALNNLSQVLLDEGKLDEAEIAAREAVAIDRGLSFEVEPPVATALNTLAGVLNRQRKWPEAESTLREALGLKRRLLGNEHPETLRVLSGLTVVLEEQGRLPEAESTRRELLAVQRKTLGGEDPEVAKTLSDLARLLWDQGRLTEAEATFVEALGVRRKLGKKDDPNLGGLLNDLGLVLHQQGKAAEAEPLLREALAIFRIISAAAPSRETPDLAIVLHHLADVMREEKKHDESLPLAHEAVALYLGHPAWAAEERCHAQQVLAAVFEAKGDLAQAEVVYREQLDDLRTRLPADDLGLAGQLAQLTLTLLAERKFDQAEAVGREALAIREKKSPDDWRSFSTRSMVGASLLGQKKYAQAEPFLLSGYEGMSQRAGQIPPEGRPRLEEALQRLVELYEGIGEITQAERWRSELEASRKNQNL